MYCSHRLPCPSQIDIAAITQLLDAAALDRDSIPAQIREQYQASIHKASECIACGSCESKCPFNVQIIENMEKAAAFFEQKYNCEPAALYMPSFFCLTIVHAMHL